MPFQPTVRRRVLRGPNLHARFVEQKAKSLAETKYYDRRLDGIQITESEGHPFRNEYSGKDEGGDFRTLKDTTKVNLVASHLQTKAGANPSIVIDGVYSPIMSIGSGKEWTPMPKESLSFSSDLDTKGTEAITLSNPLNPVGDAATFLTETIGERLPSLPAVRLWKERTQFLLGAADEFLNAEFGWLPMLREIGDFADAVKTSASVMKQYQRDAGRLVRRSWYFPIEKSETRKVTTEIPNSPLLGGVLNAGGELIPPRLIPVGRTVETKQTRRKVWFKGAFTYSVPSQSDAWQKLIDAASGRNAANVAFGSSLTPETLWELAPWSWALDWFSNAQEVVSNLQLFELQGLVMPYGYVMDEKSVITTYSWEHVPSTKLESVLTVPDIVRTHTTKMRKQASPFGFGLEWSDLSITQLAILAALGITLAL